MRKLTWFNVVLGAVMCSTLAIADGGIGMSGSFEAGLNLAFPSSGGGSRLFSEAMHMHFNGKVSDKTKVQLHTAFFLANAQGSGAQAASRNMDEDKYLGAMNASSIIYIDRMGLEHGFGDHTMFLGYGIMPFGMESMGSRFDYHTYYYSGSYTAIHAGNRMYDAMLGFTFKNLVPGTLEVVLNDGLRALGNTGHPGLAARYSIDVDAGDMTVTPVLSTGMDFSSGIRDFRFSGGLKFKMSDMFLNAEWLQWAAGTAAANRSLYFEPGMMFGDTGVSAKLDLTNSGATSDMNIGFAVSHNYSAKFRIRLTGMLANMSTSLHPDFRVLVGTSW